MKKFEFRISDFGFAQRGTLQRGVRSAERGTEEPGGKVATCSALRVPHSALDCSAFPKVLALVFLLALMNAEFGIRSAELGKADGTRGALPDSALRTPHSALIRRVLQLDGTNSYVELPPNIFDSLTQATVEGWVKWDRLRSTDRFFDFGDRNREMYVRPDGEQLNYMACAADGVRNRIEVAGILHPNEWCHIAAVSGPG